jgi:hypothetical protein
LVARAAAPVGPHNYCRAGARRARRYWVDGNADQLPDGGQPMSMQHLRIRLRMPSRPHPDGINPRVSSANRHSPSPGCPQTVFAHRRRRCTAACPEPGSDPGDARNPHVQARRSGDRQLTGTGGTVRGIRRGIDPFSAMLCYGEDGRCRSVRQRCADLGWRWCQLVVSAEPAVG